ncbi:MAG: hypothetical protein LBT40_07420 [Deltaproteobacteria bacterium]|jgi:hypothetical protein|nr:hypothetical protein [Deltaproteobacteria bacterium]
MTNPSAKTAQGLSGTTGESAGQNSLEQFLQNLRSAPAAQIDSFRRLLFPTNADGPDGVRQAPQIAVSPEAEVHWVTRHQFAIGIVIPAAVAIFAVLLTFVLYSLYSLDNRINLLTTTVGTRTSGLSKEVSDFRVEMTKEIAGLKSSIDRLLRDMGELSASGGSREPSRPPNDPAGAESPGRSAPPAAGPEVPAPE